MLYRWKQKILEKLECNFLAKKLNSIFSKLRLTGRLEGLADVPRVLRSTLRKFSWNCTVKVIHIGGAASKNDDYPGENEVVPALLYFLCWSLKNNRVQFWDESIHQHLPKRVYEMKKSDSGYSLGFCEFQREAKNSRGVSFPESGGARQKNIRGLTRLQ